MSSGGDDSAITVTAKRQRSIELPGVIVPMSRPDYPEGKVSQDGTISPEVSRDYGAHLLLVVGKLSQDQLDALPMEERKHLAVALSMLSNDRTETSDCAFCDNKMRKMLAKGEMCEHQGVLVLRAYEAVGKALVFTETGEKEKEGRSLKESSDHPLKRTKTGSPMKVPAKISNIFDSLAEPSGPKDFKRKSALDELASDADRDANSI